MAFNDIPKIEDYQTYLDIAFKNGKNAATSARQERIQDKLKKSRHIEKIRVEAMARSLINTFDTMQKRFPQLDDLAPFYQELIKCTLDYDELKKSLGAITWTKQQIKRVLDEHKKRFARAEGGIVAIRKSFSGRVSSIVEQIKPNLDYLEKARKTLKTFPSLKTGRTTIVIAGAPNVGKSTLLAVLTGSNPETAAYPFTTKNLNLGYDADGNQYIDTPGLLDRPIAERNTIEQHSILALKHLASVIIFIIDPSESCGYPLPEQQHLYNDIKKRFPQPILLVSNKADTGQTYKNALAVSATTGQGIPELKEKITAALSQQASTTKRQ